MGMTTFDDLEREISEQNAALESLLAELENEIPAEDAEIANENLFKDSVTIDDLLEKVKAKVEECESKEDCEKLLGKLKDEEDKFNKCFKDMKDAAEKFKDGKIEKAELQKAIVDAMKEIKKCCNLLTLKDVNEDLDEVTDDEIKMLRDFLTGSRELIEEKCESFKESKDDDDKEDSKEEEKEEDDDIEEEDVAEESILEIAEEGNNLDAREAKKNYGKEAKQLAKEAKKLYKQGNYAEAKEKWEAAANLADELVKEVDNLDPSVGSAVLGYFAHQAKIFAVTLLVSIPTLGLGSIVVGIKELIDSISALIAAINKISKGELSINDFNQYTNRIKTYGKKLAAEYRKCAKKCGESGKAQESFMEGYMKAIEDFSGIDFEDMFDDVEEE